MGYGIQSTLDKLPHDIGVKLVNVLKPHLQDIKTTKGGRRIIAIFIKHYSMELKAYDEHGFVDLVELTRTARRSEQDDAQH